MKAVAHDRLVKDQFTRQAVVFSTAKAIADEKSLKLLVDFSQAQAHDTVLDLACGELQALFAEAGLPPPQRVDYELRDLLDNLLARSFPNAGDEEKIRALYSTSIDDDRLGIPLQRRGSAIEYAYPVQVFRSRKV